MPEELRLDVVKQGMLTVVNQLWHHPLPVDSWWVCGAPKDSNGPFEASVTLSQQQITLILHTHMPGLEDPDLVEDRRVRIVRKNAKGDVVVVIGQRSKDGVVDD